MKICPECSFANEDRFPTCVYCNAVIANVPSTPAADPDHPEHAKRALLRKRHAIARRQVCTSSVLYALAITVLAVIPGLVWNPISLLCYFLSGLLVAFAIVRGTVGQFTAPILQGSLSVFLVVARGPVQPFLPFMLVGHIVIPAVLWHSLEMIENAHR